jgi:hypothetical protein
MTDEEIVRNLLGSTTFDTALKNLVRAVREIALAEFRDVVIRDLGTVVQINLLEKSLLDGEVGWGIVVRETGNIHPAGATPHISLSFPPVANIYDELSWLMEPTTIAP